MQLETGNNVNNYQLSIRLILREPGDRITGLFSEVQISQRRLSIKYHHKRRHLISH